MENQDTKPVYASPKEVAGTIAAVYGESPSSFSISMVGSQAVEKFVSEIMAAQENTHKVALDLD
jgi:stage V sporulation protein SpoVS